MYAIVVDLDPDTLIATYPTAAWEDAFNDVRSFLAGKGFARRQGGVYFGDETVDEVSCVLAIQDLTEEFDWFAPAVHRVNMLRIESTSDLMPAVARALTCVPD